jgi:hypothetical protein
MKLPRSMYGAEHDGLLDSERLTAEEPARTAPARLVEERRRRRSPSDVVRRLQA